MKRPRKKLPAGSGRLRFDCLERRQLLAAMLAEPAFEAEALQVEVAPVDSLLKAEVARLVPALAAVTPLALESHTVDLGVILGDLAGSPTGAVTIPIPWVGSHHGGPLVLHTNPPVSRPIEDGNFTGAATGGIGTDLQLNGRPGQSPDDVTNPTLLRSSRPGPQLTTVSLSRTDPHALVTGGTVTSPVSLDPSAASSGFGLVTNRWSSDPAVVVQGHSAPRDGIVPNAAEGITEVGIDFADLLAVATQNTQFGSEGAAPWRISDRSAGLEFTAGTPSDVDMLPMGAPQSQEIASDTSLGRYRYVEVASEPLRPGAPIPNQPSAQSDAPHRTEALSKAGESPIAEDGEPMATYVPSPSNRYPFLLAPSRARSTDATGPAELAPQEIEPLNGWWGYVQQLAKRLTGVADVLVASSATAGFVLLSRGLDPDEQRPPSGRPMRPN